MSIIARKDALLKSHLMKRMRSALWDRGFEEVHTPVLLREPGPAQLDVAGKPYTLRPCMELLLRSALASGLEKVYDLGPCFRPGDGVDHTHHPEFYMLELFQEGLDYAGLQDLTQALLATASMREDLAFERVDVSEWLMREFNLDLTLPHRDMIGYLVDRGAVPADYKHLPLYRTINHLVAIHLEPSAGCAERPVMFMNFPTCTVSLARRVPGALHLIERFEVFVNGIEVAHGFVDECDPGNLEQRTLENGMDYSPEILSMLRSGLLKPSAGVGFGIERLLLAFFHVCSISDLVHENQFTE